MKEAGEGNVEQEGDSGDYQKPTVSIPQEYIDEKEDHRQNQVLRCHVQGEAYERDGGKQTADVKLGSTIEFGVVDEWKGEEFKHN